jgi:hypothetical protein
MLVPETDSVVMMSHVNYLQTDVTQLIWTKTSLARWGFEPLDHWITLTVVTLMPRSADWIQIHPEFVLISSEFERLVGDDKSDEYIRPTSPERLE